MNYESQEHYEHEMGAAGEAEAEAQAEASYYDHLQSLIDTEQYDLWALETCANRLDKQFPLAAQHLRKVAAYMKAFAEPTDDQLPSNSEIDDLPF